MYRRTTKPTKRSKGFTILPKSWMPYAKLMRIDKAAETAFLFFPCLLGSSLVSCVRVPAPSAWQLIAANSKLFLWSFWFRSLAYTWNEIVHHDIDRLVRRTALRPLVKRPITTTQASIFASCQLALGCMLTVWLISIRCLLMSIPPFLVMACHPFAKRSRYYPQLILSVPASWGIILAFMVLDASSDRLVSPARSYAAAGCLFVSCVAWTVLSHAIYAAQDMREDREAVTKSTMIRHHPNARGVLRYLATIQLLGLLSTTVLVQGGFIMITTTILGTRAVLLLMLSKVDLHSPRSCAWWFRKGNMAVGFAMVSGLIVEYRLRAV